MTPAPRTAWCDEHNQPMRTIRTGDDRIVCWFVWWTEAMSRPRFDYEVAAPEPQPCRPGTRIVIDIREPA